MLINYNGQYADVSTLAHELGHTMQSYFSNKTQPYPLAGYPIFVAEVASTFNESLLIDHMLKNIKDDDTRLSLLGNYLENIKGTVFRQTQFAEFELRMHEMAQKGQPITGDALAKLYMDITKRYYGHDQGVCIVDDYIAHEWSYIPHFYRDFYVFQYATSFTASEALAQKVKAGDAGRDEEVSGVSLGRRIEVSDRSAEGRRRRHDDRRAARPDDEGNESRDGRDGKDSRQASARAPLAYRAICSSGNFPSTGVGGGTGFTGIMSHAWVFIGERGSRSRSISRSIRSPSADAVAAPTTIVAIISRRRRRTSISLTLRPHGHASATPRLTPALSSCPT